jgi:hypothetical protein
VFDVRRKLFLKRVSEIKLMMGIDGRPARNKTREVKKRISTSMTLLSIFCTLSSAFPNIFSLF